MVRKMKATVRLSLLLLALICLPQTVTEAKEIRLNKTKVQMNVGEKMTLKVKGAKKKKVTWKSNKPKVVKVTKKGVIKAKKEGKAVIRAKVGEKTLKCKVTVKKKAQEVPDTTGPVIPEKDPYSEMGTNQYTQIMDAGALDDAGKSTRSLAEYTGMTTLTNNLTANMPVLTGKQDFTGLQNFSWNFFSQAQREAAEKNKENVVVSPASAYIALAMAGQGAVGNTRTQFSEVLGLTPDLLKQNTNVNALKRHLMTNKGRTTLNLANSFWMDSDIVFKESYLQSVVDYFDSEIYGGDLASEDAKNAINQWASEKTNGMIPNLLNEKLDEDTAFSLMNAIYFNAKWSRSLGEYFQKVDFTKTDGTKVEAKYLCAERYMDYIRTPDAEGVVLPYDDGKTVFLALRPANGKSIKDFATSLDAKTVKYYISWAKNTPLDFRMPEFEYYAKGMDLISILNTMGLTDVFDKYTADLSDMCIPTSPLENIYVDKVQQDVKIKVKKDGTEAAAVTGIGSVSAPMSPREEPEYIKFHLDSSYVYVVMDLSTQAPLFAGVMEDPTITE